MGIPLSGLNLGGVGQDRQTKGRTQEGKLHDSSLAYVKSHLKTGGIQRLALDES